MSEEENSFDGDDSAIAIVGMACHLPGAPNLQQYWSNLCEGVESIRFYSEQELLDAGETAAMLADPSYVRAQPYLAGFDRFDAKFWGFSPQDAAVTDPAHRIFLEVAYHALEHSGHTGYDSEETVGVFATSGASLYWMDNLKTNPQLMHDMGEFLVRHTGNDMNFLATRLSYELDLRGPSLNIQTACSSSLVAIHMAAQSLLAGECDLAIAGGSTVLLPQQRGYLYKEGEIMSPDGHCRPFDASSAGTVFGSGAGAIILRRLDDALADGDKIYGVIAGSAINNDGAQKAGYLAPGVEGQAAVIAEALAVAGIDAADVNYIEAHGTGTQVGDPIEFEALNQVYRAATHKRAYCRVGSVKSNIGHLGEAAGAAAIIKVALALDHQQIPPTLNYQTPNVEIDLNNSPFLINNTLEPWPVGAGHGVAGVTALGAGGTNAHIVLRQAPKPVASECSEHKKQLLILSAKSPTALREMSRNLAASLRAQVSVNLADVAYTLQIGRRAYSHRRVLTVTDREDAISALDAVESSRMVDAEAAEKPPSLIFMFPGGGAQYAGMGAELYASEPNYRAAFDDCLACVDADLSHKIRTLVLDENDALDSASKTLEQPSLALPALLATEYALAKLLISWGAQPDGFMGHSMGEYTAACLAGVIALRDAMRLVVLRGRLFEKIARGGMLSMALSEPDARQYLGESLDIAAVNAPNLCVASGPERDIEQLQQRLEANAVDCSRIRIDVAAHSSMLDEVLEEFRIFCQAINFSTPHIAFTSNVSGGWITTAQATDPNYWVQHLRSAVRFSDNVAAVIDKQDCVFVEVGPGQVLSNLARASTDKAQVTISAMRHPKEHSSDLERALKTLGHIWAAGILVDWRQFWGQELRNRVALPPYPFERKAYWIEAGKAHHPSVQPIGALRKRENIDDWFSRFCWRQSTARVSVPKLESANIEQWLIFEDDLGLSELLVTELGHTAKVIKVRKAEVFSQVAENCYQLSVKDVNQLEQLFEILELKNNSSLQIVYLCPVTQADAYALNSSERYENYEKQVEINFFGLLSLAKALSERIEPATLTVVSSDLYAINGSSCPEKATLLGVVGVLPRELPHVKTKSIDISPASVKVGGLAKLARQILKEISSESSERIVAFRGLDRWIRRFESTPLQKISDKPHWLRSGANVLITGGLGGIGLTIAKTLAAQGAATLILLGRRSLPDRGDWAGWLLQHSELDSTAQKILQVQGIEALGATVLCISADVSDYETVQRAVDLALKKCGIIHGVVHAAGTIDDQIILSKTRESASSVMNAKIRGALILDRIFSQGKLDFFVVFSSVAAFLGLPGQVDYMAANAFLDAFISERAQQKEGQSVAISWNAWRETGMASVAQKQVDFPHRTQSALKRAHHVWFDHYVDDQPSARIFSNAFSVEKHWLLSEHRVKNGNTLMPGTGFVELLCAAFSDYCAIKLPRGNATNNAAIELTDIRFIEAFQVQDGQPKWLHVNVEGDADDAMLTLFSDSRESAHVIARAKTVTVQVPKVDLSELSARCNTNKPTRGRFLDQDFMHFGGRWGCIKSISAGVGEALLHIELPADAIPDCEALTLHPALLDMATGGAQFLISDFKAQQDFYVPVAYQRLVVWAAMPASFFSHVRVRENSAPGFAIFDVMLLDSAGQCFTEIFGFTMKKIAAGFAVTSASNRPVNDQVAQKSSALSDILQEAISPAEGADAFNRVMSQGEQSHWIVSSVDADLWLRKLDNPNTDTGHTQRVSYVKEELHDADADSDIPIIEEAFSGHAKVLECVVRSFSSYDLGRRLVLYYTLATNESVDNQEFLSFARSVLSEALVPQFFCRVDAFEKTVNGTYIRANLADPLALVDNYIVPKTKTEKTIATLWQEVIGIERIGLGENFFELGGHSLLLIRLVAKINRALSVNLEISKLFDNPKIENWAGMADQLMGEPVVTRKKITRVSRGAHKIVND